jgi:hypothetical protein
MSKKNQNKKKAPDSLSTLSFGKYNELFEHLKVGEKRNLRDTKSDKNSSMPIEVIDEHVYMTEPDGKLIPNIQNQHKCDFLIYCRTALQTCFVELKGENITVKEDYNPYDQIMDTIKYLKDEDELKELVGINIEKHAFIVSPGRQKIPKGIESKERLLWQKLVQGGMEKRKIADLVHYVKVTKTDRYSNNVQIICSPKSPIKIPFVN